MNVLLVHNYYKIPGGEDTVVANEMNLLESNGHKVYLYHKSNDELDSYNGIKKLVLPFNTVFSLKTYKELKQIIKREKIDIMHVHNTVCVISPSAYYAAFSCGIPVVQTIHNFRFLCPGATLQRDGKICEECIERGVFHACKYNCYRNSKLNTFALAFTTAFHKAIGTYRKCSYICLTEFNRNKLLEINRPEKQYIKPENVYVKPNFTDHRSVVVPWSERKNQIVYAGRIDETKGMRILLKAWEKIKDVDLVICGTGPEEEWCRKTIEEKSLDNVKMLGFTEHEQMMEIIGKSKALILPTQWYEGFPMVLVESFACGTPVIGSRIGNVGSIIQEGINGFVVDQTDANDIVKAVANLTDITASTRNSSDELYSVENNYRQLMDIYNRVRDRASKR